MKINADFHIHSYLSRSTSKRMHLENIYKWCQLKGIQVIGTGDFTHPEWLIEISEKLEPAEDGLFRLKKLYANSMQAVSIASQGEVRFVISGEISNIYKKNGRVRKVHNLVILPDIKTAISIQKTLEKIGNIKSDGRPILGLDSRNLLEIVLDAHPQACLIPAHIWTPWFSVLGSKSGFDSIEECFDDLSTYVFALETGLSSDPPMNWRLSKLDKFTLISNSDAHSPEKIARESTMFDTELSYTAILEAMRTRDPKSFLGTVEFFPQEGKYHYDGHRKCQARLDPITTISNKGLCPICRQPVTIGVMHRVEILADRPYREQIQENLHITGAITPPFYSLIPLIEIISEIKGTGVNSKAVKKTYLDLIGKLGSELEILMDVPLDEIAQKGTDILSEAIRRMRNCEVHTLVGYDGEFGIIKVF